MKETGSGFTALESLSNSPLIHFSRFAKRSLFCSAIHVPVNSKRNEIYLIHWRLPRILCTASLPKSHS